MAAMVRPLESLLVKCLDLVGRFGGVLSIFNELQPHQDHSVKFPLNALTN